MGLCPRLGRRKKGRAKTQGMTEEQRRENDGNSVKLRGN